MGCSQVHRPQRHLLLALPTRQAARRRSTARSDSRLRVSCRFAGTFAPRPMTSSTPMACSNGPNLTSGPLCCVSSFLLDDDDDNDMMSEMRNREWRGSDI